jgi:hypothetical protein
LQRGAVLAVTLSGPSPAGGGAGDDAVEKAFVPVRVADGHVGVLAGQLLEADVVLFGWYCPFGLLPGRRGVLKSYRGAFAALRDSSAWRHPDKDGRPA